MHSDKYLEGIVELYQGEVYGEGLFSTLLAECPEEHAYGMALLLQLEGEAKVRLRPLLWRHGLSVVENEAERTAGIEEAVRIGRLPWRDAMGELAALVRRYLPRYQALAAGASDSDRPYCHFMVTHEETVLRFAELTAAGDPQAALQAVRAQLEHPWPADRGAPKLV
jgi:hypothetical protein